MSIYNRDKYIIYLMLIPGLGGIVACGIFYIKKMRSLPNETSILFKFFIICSSIAGGMGLLSKFTFEYLAIESLTLYASLIPFIISGLMINLYFIFIYKNQLFPMVYHNQISERETVQLVNDHKVYKLNNKLYLFIPIIGVFILYITNYVFHQDKSITRLFVSWFFVVVSTLIFFVIVYYMPVLSNSINLNYGQGLLFILSSLVATILNDIIYLLYNNLIIRSNQ